MKLSVAGRMNLVQDIAVVADKLGERELRCYRRIGERLLEGQRAYGLLAPGKKDWKKEAKEEAMDMSVYLSALLEDDTDE